MYKWLHPSKKILAAIIHYFPHLKSLDFKEINYLRFQYVMDNNPIAATNA